MLRSNLFVALTASLALVVSCAPAPPAAQPAGPVSPAGPKLATDQRIAVGQASLVNTMDPHATLGNNARRYGLFESLTALKADGTVAPSLASEWKNLTPTTWQFTLAKGRSFHDGSPVTIEDVRWSYARAIDPNNKLPAATRIATVTGVETTGPESVVITTKGPDPILLSRMTQLAILPKGYFERVGAEEFGIKPVGSGPFRLKQFVPGDRLELAGMAEHPSKPTLTDLSIRVIPEASARVAGLRTGELDLIVAVPLDQVDSLKSAGNQVVSLTASRSNGAVVDAVVDGPTKHKEVRQALNYAIDKDLLVKQIFRGLTIPDQGQPIPREAVGFNPDLKPYPYDPAKAKQLLAAAGYPTGFKTRADVWLFTGEMQSIWLLVQSQLKEVGVEVELNTFSDTAKQLDIFYGRVQRSPLYNTGSTTAPLMDADASLTWFRGTQPGENGFGTKHYSNPEFDRLYDQFEVELDPTKRRDLIRRALAIFHEDPPYLFLAQGLTVWVVNPKLEGVVAQTDQDPAYEFLRKVQ